MEVEVARGFARLALGELVRDGGEERERGAVHHRCAKPAHDPRARAIIGEAQQIDDVLEDRETGADGEAGDDRVELVADAVEAEESDDDHPLDRLLDPRRDEAAVAVEADRQRVEEAAGDRVSGERADAAEHEQQQDLAQPHQLERVEPDEDGEKDQDGNKRESPMRGLRQQLRHLT